MSDLIDRQVAIDALEEYADRLQIVDWKENPGVPYKAYALNWCINTIRDLPSAQPEPHWIPCSERLPEEDHWLGGSGKQFSDNVLISIVNRDDEDAWVQVSQTIDGTWALELPRYCKVVAWMPLPEAYREGE